MSRWWRLAIAAVVPLVLTVCVTPPGPVDQAPRLDAVDVAAPSSTALVAAEPARPMLPVLEDAAALPQPAQPVIDADLAGAGGTANLTALMEPERPPNPDVSGVVLVAAMAAPAAPAGGVPGQAALMEPERPPNPDVSRAMLVAAMAAPAAPVGAGAGGMPGQMALMEPERPPNPDVSGAMLVGAMAEPAAPVGVGAGGVPGQMALMEPERPSNPDVSGVMLVNAVSEPAAPVGVGAGGVPGQMALMEPGRPSDPDVSGVMRIAAVSEPVAPVGVGAGGVPGQMTLMEPGRPSNPDVSGVMLVNAVSEPVAPVGVGAGGTPAQQAAGVEPAPPPYPEVLAMGPRIELVEPAPPMTAGGADAVRERVAQAEPSSPPPPLMAVMAVPVSLTHPQPSSAGGPTVIEAPTDADFDRVRVLIARAEEANAEFYDPQNLETARAMLRTAERLLNVDPGGARMALQVAEVSATEAFENSVRLAAERLRKLLAERLEELREIQADLWVPVAFQEMVDAVQQVEELYRSGDLFGAYRLALTTADAMLALRDSLLDRLEVLYGARAEAERCLAEAQRLDTSEWSQHRLDQMQSLYQQLNALYLTGLEAMQSYRLTDAEEAFLAAVEVCRRLMAVADEGYIDDMERAAEMLLAVMKEIEAASELTVVTELGEVILPQPWSGQEVLDALRAGGAQRQAVLDGVEREDDAGALRKAQALWIDGVVANDDGKYRQAMALFEDARRYLDLYKLYAVLAVYTVRYIPDRRDSLWRIAEYDFHYGDPFLWPRIWRRNRTLIQNPDLIYPNWQLIIPAL